MTEAPMMAYPLPEVPFILDTDASNLAVRAVLSQIQEGGEKVIAYFSRTLNKPEKQYCVTRKELLAIIKAVKHFHHYLYGRPFIICTDHSALRWLFNFREPEGQIARWIQKLQEYTFSIQHRAGPTHNNADSLSRRPCLKDMCHHCECLEAKQKTIETNCNHATKAATESVQLPRCRQVTFETIHSTAEWQQAQRADTDIQPIMLWMQESPERPGWESVASYSPITKMYWAQWKSLRVQNGILYRLWESPTEDDCVWQLVLPKRLQKEVFELLHNLPSSGHFGINKTVKRVQQRFYWPQSSRDIKKWCAACDLCASKKGPMKKPRARLQQYNVGAPMERIAMDVLGPLPESTTGNKYIIIIADYFTKWPEAFAIPNQEATTIANLLVREVVCRYGVPLELHSDQGRNFESTVFAEMCSLLGIGKTHTTPYHPQSDVMVEQLNRTLETQLSMFVQDHQKDWEVYLPILMMAYRTAIHDYKV
ncbi:MAG: DDE-type integrase/transposase/recombinase [Proteobacteria bacterium]|nr:DDE-type integrase/transposase/recombinase [Pseudomonadota bacterium]